MTLIKSIVPGMILAVAGAAMAQPGTGGSISHNNASFTLADVPISTTHTGPITQFQVGGAGNPNHLFQSWWWTRNIGDNREFPLAGVTGSSWIGNTGRLEYGNNPNGYLIQNFQVIGFGSGGVLLESLTIINNTPSPVRWDLFHYADVDLGGTASGDSASLLNAQVISITDGPWMASYEGSGTYEVGAFPSVRNLLTNSTVDNFTNSTLPFGPGDFTGGWQWTFTLNPGQATTITTSLTIVPAPGSAAILACGLIIAGRRQRR